METCSIIPTIKNKDGKVVESKLFNAIQALTSNNRKDSIKLYLITKSEDFIKNWLPKLKLDDNGEPTMTSLLKNTDFNKIIHESNILKSLNTTIGYYKKGTEIPDFKEDTNKNAELLVDKAIQFNDTSECRDTYVATIVTSIDSDTNKNSIAVKIERKNKDNAKIAKDMKYNRDLNKRLEAILESKGVAIGALNTLERRLGVSGATDFSVAHKSAEGIKELIRLAEGIKGAKALPEEFAHFSIDALGNSPLVSRLVNFIHSKGLTSEILGDEYAKYSNYYKGNDEKLAKEAAGKLLAKHLLQQQEIKETQAKPLLQRLVNMVKSLFRNISISDIEKAENKAANLSTEILSGNLDNDIQISNIKSDDIFYQVSDRNEKLADTLNKIIENESKRLHIYKLRTASSTFEPAQIELINELEKDLYSNEEVKGISLFISNTLDVVKTLREKLKNIDDDKDMSLNKRAALLRDVRNYMYSYNNILDVVLKSMFNEELYTDNKYADSAIQNVKDIRYILANIEEDYKDKSYTVFINFLKQFIGESVEIKFGKYKGQTIKVDKTFIEEQSKDISFFDRWLDSMADSSSLLLRVIDKAVKTSKGNARLETISYSKKIKAAGVELFQAGIKNFDFMFEKDDEGNLTGFYIRPINYGKFESNKKKMYKNLREKYGENPEGADANAFKMQVSIWYENNMEVIDNKKVPKRDIYENKDYTTIMEAKTDVTTAQKKFLTTIFDIKKSLDSVLPENYTTLENAVKIRKDFVERAKSSSSIKSSAKEVWEGIKDLFIKRSDDTMFATKAGIQDFDNKQVQVLPIYYTKLNKGENPNDISTDVVSTMCAYAAMASDFNQMNKIIDCLEIGRDLIRKTTIAETKANKPVVERFSELGRKVENKLVKTENKRIVQRLDDYYEMQVYNGYTKDEGNFGNTNISVGKTVNFINLLTAINSLGFSLLNGISNIATGTSMMRIETLSRQFFRYKDLTKADSIYASELPSFIGDVGKKSKISKINLFDELFNVLQDYEQKIKDSDFAKSNIGKLFSSHPAFVLNNAGEHWMQNRTALALACSYKMKYTDENGKSKDSNLWDALEIKYIDPNNKDLGAELVIKEGYTKTDGTKFTKDDINNFTDKSAYINQHMHGIYNDLDKSAIQNLALGRMAILFRKWIVPSMEKRFSHTNYSLMGDTWSEGYYRTFGNFLLLLGRDIKEGQFNLGARFKELSPEEISNVTRATVEIGQFLMILLAISLFNGGNDKDRKRKRSWANRMTEYQLYRLKTELGVLIPGPSMLKEGGKIIQAPAAGISTLEQLSNTINLLIPANYTNKLQSGRYKGHSTAHKTIMDSPLFLMNKSIFRGINPETGLPYFKQY